MARFFFHLIEADLAIVDEEGRELPNAEIAIAEAVKEARNAVAFGAQRGILDLSGAVEVTSHEGGKIASLSYAQALTCIRI